jgi:hypothetical protein
MGTQDHSYKHLFSHPRMVEDLLRGFVLPPLLLFRAFHRATRQQTERNSTRLE